MGHDGLRPLSVLAQLFFCASPSGLLGREAPENSGLPGLPCCGCLDTAGAATTAGGAWAVGLTPSATSLPASESFHWPWALTASQLPRMALIGGARGWGCGCMWSCVSPLAPHF
jgi:hypothetical protein